MLLVRSATDRTPPPRDEVHTAEVRIFQSTALDVHPVELSLVGWRTFPPCTFRVPRTALLALEPDADAYGRALGQALFAESALGPHYREAMAAVRPRSATMRVRLRLDDPALDDLRWERLFQPVENDWAPIAIAAGTPYSRFVPPQRWDRQRPITERPLKLLLVIASPADLPDYGLEPIAAAECAAIGRMLQQLPGVAVTSLESRTARRPTATQLRATITDEGFHFVHFLCHGARTPAGACLYLENDSGNVEPLTIEQLLETFTSVAAPPVFCFLGACESAARARTDAVVPLGSALIAQGGVHALLGMSGRVGVQTAHEFTTVFYTRLLAHGQVDVAVNQARALVREQGDWSVPVLFSLLPDNQLIDFPVGDVYTYYLSHTDKAYDALNRAMPQARQMDEGDEIVAGLRALLAELRKSHQVLVDVASNFRNTGAAPDTFRSNFELFRNEFKRYYDSQDWVHEDTSCGQIATMRDALLPRLENVLDKNTYDDLRAELGILGSADAAALVLFKNFLDAMDTSVDEIWNDVHAGHLQQAIEKKLAFEATITPSFRRSKAMLQQMNQSVGHVSAA
jgi:hypothetical protein